jgi:hypothetical protein
MACATSGRGWLVRVVDKAVGPRFQNFAAVPVDRAGPRHLEASELSGRWLTSSWPSCVFSPSTTARNCLQLCQQPSLGRI